MMLKQIYRLTAAMICLMVALTACVDEREKGQMQSPQETEDELVTLTFRAMVPGMTEATRVAGDGSVDEYINQLELYLFDHKNGFSGVVQPTTLTHNNQYTNTVETDNQYTASGEYNANEGTYTVTIPKNTTLIHFLANYDREKEGFDIEEHIGRTETEVFGPLVTQNRIYWGRAKATFDNSKGTMTVGQNPIVLYRNYAKVRVKEEVATGLHIYGWTLYRQPTHSSVPPFDASKIDHNPNDGVSTNPFEFGNLADLKVTPPIYALRTTQPDDTQNRTHALENISKYTATAAHWMFEYDDEQYRSATDGQSNRVFAIFKIGYQETDNATEDVRLYKIELLKTTGEGTSAKKEPYDIIRNWQYTIHFNGITPDFGIPVADADNITEAELEQVINALPANDNEVTIEKTLPEVVSTQYTLRVEDKGKGSTIRYYKTDEIAAFTNAGTNSNKETLYNVNDITIYYNGANNDASNLTATWEDGEQMEGAEDITITPKGDNLFTLSFNTTNFTDSQTASTHYKWGRIRISENVEGLLSRYVKVYIGPSITFRPLLYSSDIPNLVDERLTVLFSIPGTDHLPADLYPIEVRFGSDRVDVERNNEVASMKVDVANSATDVAALDYEDVLRWEESGDNTSYYQWTSRNTNGDSQYDHIVQNTWGYEYVYTIESPAESGQKRITLRTVNKSKKDFRVMMEGRSTVTSTPVFNTRELFFQMQNNGTSEFAGGTWDIKTEGANDQYNRIMLENGMPETRYVTAYVNAIKQQATDGTGAQDITVSFSYDLGTYDTDSKTKTPTAPSSEVKLWAYYDKTKLTPTSITAGGITTTKVTEYTDVEGFTEYTDVEGNTFIRFTHGTGSPKGTLTFTAKGGTSVQNSMIFLTARNTDKYGTFMQDMNGTYAPNASTSTYCGENALAQSYRSAGAIINIRNSWDFNPAPSLTVESGSYSFATSIAMDYGKDKDLYLRIDRPANTEGVKLTFDTGGKFKLLDKEDEYTIDSRDDTNGKYTITLTKKNSEYCYLHFQSLLFKSGGTISMASATDDPATTDTNEASAVPYNPATLEVTNNAISFVHFQFANEEDMAGTTVTYYDADADKNIHRTLYPIKGAQVGVRVYFPSAMTSQSDFRFRLSSNCFKVVDNGKTVNNVDAYSVENYSGTEEDQLIIKTTGPALTTDPNDNECAYLDILLQSTCIASTENVKFLGAGGADDFHFYPYIVGLLHDGTKEYTVKVEHQKDGMSSFTSEPLADVGPEYGKSIITYSLTLPNLGNRAYTIPVKITHHGYFKDISSDKVSGDETKYKYVSHDDTSYDITVETNANKERTVTFSFEIDTAIPTGSTIPVTFDIGGDVVKLTPNPTILKLADLLPLEATLSISTDGGNSYTEVAEGGTYLNIPTNADQSVKIKITPTTQMDAADEFTIDMLTRGLIPNNSTHPAENCTDKKDQTDNTSTRIAGYTITGVTGDKNGIIIDLKTKTEGTAEMMTIGGYGKTYQLPDFTLTIASHVERNYYEIYWNTSGGNKGGVNKQIFDNDQFQACVQPTNPDNFNATLYSKYVEGVANDNIYGVKFDSKGLLSFYAPKDNMTLTIVGTGDSKNIKLTEVTGITSTENDKNQYGITYAGNVTTIGDFDTDGEAYKISLGKSGLYTLTRGSGETRIFYLRLASQAALSRIIDWTANNTNGNDLPGGRGTTNGTITDNRIEVSDFNETLTLSFPGITGQADVILNGDYTFDNGTKIQTVTPDGEGKVAVTIKPSAAKAINSGELVDGTFSLHVYAPDKEYAMENTEVYIRPYVIIDGLIINADDGYINVGETFNVTVTVPDDANTIGKDVAFSFPWAQDGSPYISQETVPAEYLNGGISKENVIAGKEYTFTWKVNKGSAGNRMILKARNGGNTDIVRTLTTKGIYNNQNFWPYLFTVEEVKVGLGTWQSSVVYENIVVKNLSNNKTVYSSGSSISEGDWLKTPVYHSDDAISYGSQLSITDKEYGATAVLNLPVHSHYYQITCRAKKTSGAEGFLILFDYNDYNGTKYKWWNIGGWGNIRHELQLNNQQPNPFISSTVTGLVTTDIWYNITIKVENGVATCTCIPETQGNYYMKYVYDPTNGSTSSTTALWNTYEYYVTDVPTERYKNVRVNGVQQTAEIDVLKMNAAYTYRTDGGTNDVTLYNGNTQSLSTGEHMGGNNQYISLDIKYPTKIYYKWTPVSGYDNKILSIYNSSNVIISNNPTSTTAGTFYDVEQVLEPGTYTLKSGDGETVLWYLRLTPVSPP